MQNRMIAILMGWFITIYFTVIILKHTPYMYNLLFLLILSLVFNLFMIDYGEDMPIPKKKKRKKSKKSKK